MTTAAKVAEIHRGSINASRKRCGLAPLSAGEVEREFSDVGRVPVSAKGVVPGARSNQAADTMWGSIVQKLNATLPSPAPIGAVRESGDAEGRVDAVVDWSSIASALNCEAGLATPVRSRAR